MEKQINKKITDIVYQVNDMIPVVWDDLYINFEIDSTFSGGVIFFFKYNGEYCYYLDIPSKFNISEEQFDDDFLELFDLGIEMKKIFVEHELEEWSAFTIKVDENNKVSLDFDYAPWLWKVIMVQPIEWTFLNTNILESNLKMKKNLSSSRLWKLFSKNIMANSLLG